MAGLLAARVLSDYFESVTVVERDQLSTNAEVRKGIPQGKHIHILMCKGTDILSELFPGLLFDEARDPHQLLHKQVKYLMFLPRLAREFVVFAEIV